MLVARFLFLLLLFSTAAKCQNPIYKTYSVSDGLPSEVIYCSMQDNDGYMWFGTDAGVSRFDGKEFKNFTVKDGLTDNDILKIYKDSKGRLWFLTLKGLLCNYYHGKIYNPANDKTIPDQKAYNGFLSFLEDSNHELWFGGIGGQLVKIPSKGRPQVFNLDPSELKKGKSGWVLLYQPGKDRIMLSGIKKAHVYNTHDFSEVAGNYNLHADSGLVYENTSTYKGVLVSNAGVIELDAYEQKTVLSSDSLPFLKKTVRIKVDPKGGIWLFTKDKNTYYFEKENGKYKPPKTYFPGQNISGVYIDNEGSRWFTTLGNGIYKVSDDQKWINVLLGGNNSESIPDENVLSLLKDHENKIWMGTENGKIYSVIDFNKPVEQPKSIIFSNRIIAIAESHNNQLFFLTDKFIFKLDRQQRQLATVLKLSSPASPKNLCFDNYNNLIFSTIGGIRKIEDVRYDETDVLLPNIPPQRTYALCTDYKNRLWFEIFERLYCYDRGKVTSYPQYDSLFFNKITSIVQTKDSALVIATQNNGIFIFKNDQILGNINTKDGLTGTLCRKLYIDGDRIYVSTNNGFTSFTYINGKVLNLKSFNSINGVLPGDVNDIVTDDKFIYLATSKGLCKIDKQIQVTRAQPPVLRINSVETEDSVITNFENLVFEYSRFNISINYIAITFDQPDKVVYQYKLESSDRWIETKSNSLQLSELSPGKYNVTIRAKKINSDWGPARTIHFFIIPPFWKTFWFQLFIFSLALLLIYYLIRRIALRNYRLQLNELKARQEIEKERSRIASDMHDDLGADISKIAVISEVIKADPEVSKSIHTNVQKISVYATELRKKMDDIIWALNPLNDKFIDLVAHIRELAADFSDESKIDSEVIVEEFSAGIILSTTLRRNLFLIIKEALNNSMKHSGATKVEIKIGIQQDKLTLEISDDGHGFDMSDKSIYGNGINNIAKRAEQINGKLEIHSIVNKGTIIKIKCPL